MHDSYGLIQITFFETGYCFDIQAGNKFAIESRLTRNYDLLPELHKFWEYHVCLYAWVDKKKCINILKEQESIIILRLPGNYLN